MYNRNTSSRGGQRPFSSQRPFQRGNRAPFNRPSTARGGAKKGRMGERIDPMRFVNKAAVTEEMERYVPEYSFADFAIEPELKRAILAKGYQTPTPIQDRAIPHILKGLDVVGIANTGTGKTGAFLIPLIDKVRRNPREQVLIVVPTRELALQIEHELSGFTKGMKIFSVCCVGGMNIGPQISKLRYSYNFIIGTPGRLKDLIDRKMICLTAFNTIVLDEADRMLDMGFINDMRFLVAGMPKERHTLFFSATLSSDIERLIKEFLREPVRISVKTGETSKNIEQDIVKVGAAANKLELLHDLLNQQGFTKVLIFARTKYGAENLSKALIRKGFKAESIHGNKTHSHRQRALSLFKENLVRILVATDVAARGLDIADVSHVINYDLPATYDDYVHRIGRTGRADKRGKALTFIE